MATMTLSTYLANKLIDDLFNDTAFAPTAATDIWISLHSGDPGTTGASELSGNGYARIAMADWAAAASKATSNGSAINFPTATGAWSEASYIGIWDAVTAGNFWLGGALTTAKTAGSGEAIRLDAGEFDITF